MIRIKRYQKKFEEESLEREKEFSQRREDFSKKKKERKHLLNSTGRIDS
ncbi:hypothetical protein KAU33_09015 [Candidatus Dependentiae bacterium]|nr:hypothetical protein [Candidatus Dependentiae bacterium]